ncbi:MAG TPA: hypothetical protein VFA26_12530 [Gemmataceae bacterium]|nr:hypothetical protein [Gemmataceae bacterium]
MIQLTDEQRRDLQGPGPARARDPRTNETYVLVREDAYRKMRAILDSFTHSAGWDDPSLDEYEQFRDQPS